MDLRWLHVAAFVVVIVNWIVFGGFFLIGKKPPRAPATRRAPASLAGIVLQGFSYAEVWAVGRPRFTPIVPLPGALEALLPIAAVVISTASVWLTLTSIRTLGKEWSYEARLVEGHRLVTAGPYGWVRHPIYTAMAGKLLATGLVVSHWIGLLAGVLLMAVGTAIRVRSEEKLLHAQFGAEYEDYARRVPAILPWRWGR
jgi:protein-S-isoprenylcysteine O-methyltransferase Ste14